MRAVIITSNNLRHMAYAKMVCDSTKVNLIIIEGKPYKSEAHFQREKEWFSGIESWKPTAQVVECEQGSVNNDVFVQIIKNTKPDIIFTFGCSLLKESIFKIPEKGCVNIHTGIVQMFRGVDSSFWAIHDDKPEGIGATLHYIDKSIDAGEIIDQRQVILHVDDDLQDLFLKSCEVGFELLKENLSKIKNGEVQTSSLKTRGKLYRNKDKTAEAKRRVDNKLKKVLQKYLGEEK
jgi:methionyl-tRNA formyltransferase